jgi:hypothetical protein
MIFLVSCGQFSGELGGRSLTGEKAEKFLGERRGNGIAGRSFVKRATAVGRNHMGQEEIGYPFVGVDLIFHPCEAVALVLVDLIIDRTTALLDAFDDLLGL